MPHGFKLYLIRHGVAEPRSDAWPDDAKRPLTESGASRCRKIGRGLGRLGVSFDIMLTSPLVRARQTAEMIGSELAPVPTIVHVDSLAPGGTYQAVLNDLEKHSRRERIALVGHEPFIGELAARLIGTRHPIAFKKGAVCRIDVESLPPGGSGALRWFLAPRMIRRLRS
jgi:phosphohistidine phosphatase